MLARVAMLVIVVAILFCNRFHYEFSCHFLIISYSFYKLKFLCYNDTMDESEIQRKRRENEELATAGRARILGLPYLDTREFENEIPLTEPFISTQEMHKD